MIDTLIMEDGRKYARTCIKPDNLFLESEGRLDRSALPELVAQAAAGFNGIEAQGAVRSGFLAVAKNISFHGDVHVNDSLLLVAFDERPMDNWCILLFSVYRETDNFLIAEGQLNLCLL